MSLPPLPPPFASRLTLIGGIVAVLFLSLAAILFVSPENNDRVALFFGLVGLIVPALIGMLRADQAQYNTNGKLDARIQAAVHRANAARRAGDDALTDREVSEL